ncbi:MAG TPA: hypothetical protein VF588_11390 [Pyrinomonadaceae bacterium]|jgi:hypothetical protein
MHLDTENFGHRVSSLSDEELWGIVTTHRAEYRQVAIELASKELMQRNIPLPVINQPMLNTAPHPRRPEQAEPEMKSNDQLIKWLIAIALAVTLIIIDEQFIKPLLHKNQVVSTVIKSITIPFAIYYLHKLYQWYKSED